MLGHRLLDSRFIDEGVVLLTDWPRILDWLFEECSERVALNCYRRARRFTMVHAHQDPNVEMFASQRRRGKEKFLRGGLALDLLFITGEYNAGVVCATNNCIMLRLVAWCR